MTTTETTRTKDDDEEDGRRSGRGARRGDRRANNNQKRVPPKKKGIIDYYFYVGSSKQASNYKNTVEFVINHIIKKTFDRGNDIAEALRNLSRPDTDKWKPSLQVSIAADAEVKAREDKQFKIE
jgi:hypothetical protein